MMPVHSSASIDSAREVDPTTSAKSAVTGLRSPVRRGACIFLTRGWGAAACSRAWRGSSSGVAATGWPQVMQNRASGGSGAEQFRQVSWAVTRASYGARPRNAPGIVVLSPHRQVAVPLLLRPPGPVGAVRQPCPCCSVGSVALQHLHGHWFVQEAVGQGRFQRLAPVPGPLALERLAAGLQPEGSAIVVL